jgi:hypothetical protein
MNSGTTVILCIAAILGFLMAVTVAIPGIESGASHIAQADQKVPGKCKGKTDIETDKKGRLECGFPK